MIVAFWGAPRIAARLGHARTDGPFSDLFGLYIVVGEWQHHRAAPVGQRELRAGLLDNGQPPFGVRMKVVGAHGRLVTSNCAMAG